ncbi:MAG: hypothetical protein LC793_24035 [Thermomicrobia bacterium]|nr:hypothetical protein [Thermomicrobia bacterium]
MDALREDYLPDERPLRIVLADRETQDILRYSADFGEGVEVMTRSEFEQWNREQDSYEDGSDEMEAA